MLSVPRVLASWENFYRVSGRQVCLVAQRPPRGWPSVPPEGISRLVLLGGDGPARGLGRAARTFFGLCRLMRRGDFVHHFSMGEWDGLTLAFFLVCVLKGARIGLTLDYYPAEFQSRAPEPDSPAWDLLRRLFYRRCEWISALSARTAAGVAARFPYLSGRIRVVPNGWSSEEKRRLARRPVAAGKPSAFCLARHCHHRAIDILLMAWRDASKEMDGAFLELAGPDHEGGRYQRFAERLGISDRVRFLGPLDRSQVWAKMEACLFFALPARYGVSGQAALEAMSCGKAVVASDTGGASDIIEDGVSGLLVPPADVAGLAARMVRLHRDADLRTRLGEAAYKRAQDYEWGKIREAYMGLWAGAS